jgi:hypothetical protein
MIAIFVTWALKAGVPQKFARPLVWILLIAMAVGGLLLIKSCYDDSVVEEARIEENAKAIEGKAEADVEAAVKRAEDQSRRATEEAEIKEVIDNAKADGRDVRAAYYRCVGLQQAARKAHRPAPACS